MKAMCWFLFYAILLMAAALFFPWPQVAGIGAVVLAVYAGSRAKLTEPKTKVLLTSIFGGTREAGPGLVIPLPDEWVATVNESLVHSVQKQVLDAKIDVEAKNKEFVTLDLSINYRITDVARYLDFKLEDFKESVIEHVRSFATDIAHECEDLDAIYEKIEHDLFEGALLAGFREAMPSGDMTVQEYHGIEVDSVVISDPEQPDEVKKARQKKLVAQAEAEALAEEAKGLKAARKALQGRVKKGEKPSVSDEKAVELVLIKSGKVQKSIHQVEIGGDTLEVLKGPLIGALKGAMKMFSPKKGGNP